MKTIKILSLLLALGICKASAQEVIAAEMQVTGLTCSMCSQATEKSLRTLDFIGDIKADLNKNLFVISFKKNKQVNMDQLKRKVQDAGFSVGGLVATMNFDQVKVDAGGQAITGGNVYRFSNVKDKTLNGPVKVKVIDKNFISNTAYKKFAEQISTEAYKSGLGVVNGKKTRIYHLSV